MARSPVIYVLPPGNTPQQPNQVIQSATWNSAMDDIANVFNTVQPIVYGGTGEATATLPDGTWRFKNSTDQTKLLALDLSGIPTGTTRTLSAPSNSGTIALSDFTFSSIRMQVFTASGTYTPNAKMVSAIIECVGGGGSGGGVTGVAGGQRCASGGGSGGYSRKWVSKADIGASRPVTVGGGGAGSLAGNGNAGGTTSVGTFCSAQGGNGGFAPIGSGGAEPPAAASTDTGDVIFPGSQGAASGGASIATVVLPGGDGGASVFGGGGAGARNGNGNAASNYGSGGGGASINNDPGSFTGGAGRSGIVIITEFIGV